MAPCLPACPLGIDIPGFVRLLREGDAVQALEVIKRQNPFPAICGRICPAPCEASCVFQSEGQSIAIRTLERYAADTASKIEKPSSIPKGKKVAIIGSGPTGMSAAYYLAKANLSVTIFEAAHEPGGLLRYGVPELRLPQKVLDEQFAQLKALGVAVQTDMVLDRTFRMDELFLQGFSAVVMATGASLPRFSDLPGSNLSGIYYDVEFLNRLQSINKEDLSRAAVRQWMPADKTVVVGRGAPAFDVARVALRLGSEVKMVFAGFEEEAGVSNEVLKESREEGLETFSMQVLEMVGEEGFVKGVKCRKLDIVEDKEGLKLEPSAEDPVILEAGTVILANGSASLKDVPRTMAGSEKIFSCGGFESVVEAIAGGKSTAQKVIQYLA
jgi:glutamate synthase (NADPH/NADH) small chain